MVYCVLQGQFIKSVTRSILGNFLNKTSNLNFEGLVVEKENLNFVQICSTYFTVGKSDGTFLRNLVFNKRTGAQIFKILSPKGI
jgi:hypothetical protein